MPLGTPIAHLSLTTTAITSDRMNNLDHPLLWGAFVVIIVVMLTVDLGLGGGRARRINAREAATWSMVWVTVSFLFAAGLWFYLDNAGPRELANAKVLEFITGYLIEKSLAVDNVFVS